jgi:hypothetical protein
MSRTKLFDIISEPQKYFLHIDIMIPLYRETRIQEPKEILARRIHGGSYCAYAS